MPCQPGARLVTPETTPNLPKVESKSLAAYLEIGEELHSPFGHCALEHSAQNGIQYAFPNSTRRSVTLSETISHTPSSVR